MERGLAFIIASKGTNLKAANILQEIKGHVQAVNQRPVVPKLVQLVAPLAVPLLKIWEPLPLARLQDSSVSVTPYMEWPNDFSQFNIF